MSSQTLPARHFLLALSVVAVWGTNFVVIKQGLAHLPPILFAALRFALVFFPMSLFLPRPPVSWRNLGAFGLLIGVGVFGVMFIAMHGSISPGLASLALQAQVFFTILLSMQLNKERVSGRQWLALGLATVGFGVIATHTDGTTTAAGLLMMMVAAASWAVANIVSKRAGQVNMLGYVVWSSVFAVPPLFALSWMLEGWPAIVAGVGGADTATWAALLWQSVANSLFGYAVWAWLLSRYPTATVTPMTLLIPVFGMAASSFFLGESMPAWKLMAMALVFTGLAINMFRRT